jgi:hypothetical protein
MEIDYMAGYEVEARGKYELGRGGIKLPIIEIKESDFYPHDSLQFLEDLWKMNLVNGISIGQPSKGRKTSYFVVPASQEKPAIFAFSETTKGDGIYDSPITTYQFFTPPSEIGGFQQVMSFTHRSSTNSGFVSGRDTLVLEDHNGQRTDYGLFGYRHQGEYRPDEFANYRNPGAYTYDGTKSKKALQLLANKTIELKDLLS